MTSCEVQYYSQIIGGSRGVGEGVIGVARFNKEIKCNKTSLRQKHMVEKRIFVLFYFIVYTHLQREIT